MRTRSSRYRQAGVLASLAMAAAALTVPTAAQGNVAGTTAADVFAPQLVTVDTPTRADKSRLQALGLDLTEHAGHDYIEVVLHTAADLAALRAAGFTYDVRIPDLLRRQGEINRIDRLFAALGPEKVRGLLTP